MRILISGYYGFKNTGDEAILLSIVRELKAQGHQVTVLSNDPVQTNDAFKVQTLGRMQPLELIRGLVNCDVLFSGGGGLLQDKTSSRTLSYYLWIIGLAQRMGKKVVIFNQSIGPLSAKGEKRVARALQKTQNLVRDRGSLALLERLGVAVTLGGDPALLLKPSSGLIQNPNQVIIAPRGGQRPSSERLAQVAAQLEATGHQIVALGFQPHEDEAECQVIAAACQNARLICTDQPQAALDVIAASSYVIGVRLHAVILAAAARVPFLGISYDPKVSGFCADLQAYAAPLEFDPQEVVEKVQTRQGFDAVLLGEMTARALESFRIAIG